MKKYTLSITPFVVILLFILLQHLPLQSLAQNVGIGTTNPAFKLDVKNGSINTDSVYRIGGNTVLSMTGLPNIAVGYLALASNTTGNDNIAVGLYSLNLNQSGRSNTAIGSYALNDNVDGIRNVAIGELSQYSNGSSFNTSVGCKALSATKASQYNTAVGWNAGGTYDNGYNNVFVGANTDVNGVGYYNVIAIGQGTVVGASNRAVFGNPATNFYGGWAPWSSFSDGRFKSNVQEKVPGFEFICKLRPVTYNVEATKLDKFLHRNTKDEMTEAAKVDHQKALKEKENITNTGFIAQEVESLAKQLGFAFSGVQAPANENDTYSLRYAEFVVPLVKAVQELSKQNDDLRKQNDEVLKRIEKLELILNTKK